MEDENIILSFKGVFTDDLLTSILHIIESKVESLGIESKKKKRIFNVLVECFQNLYHHIELFEDQETPEKHRKSALVIVKNDEGKFTVTTGNFVNRERISELERRLTMVNALDTKELRNLYRLKLDKDERSEKGTAGLGLIDIARKSGNKLEFDIIDVDEVTGFFCLNVIID